MKQVNHSRLLLALEYKLRSLFNQFQDVKACKVYNILECLFGLEVEYQDKNAMVTPENYYDPLNANV